MKKLYLMFDHEWGFKHLELYSKGDFEMATENEGSLKTIYDTYNAPEMQGKHAWFLDELSKDRKAMFDKITRIMNFTNCSSSTKESVSTIMNDWSNFKSDGTGNYIVPVEVSDQDYSKLKSTIEKLNEQDWQLNSIANKNRNVPKSMDDICKKSEDKVFGVQQIR